MLKYRKGFTSKMFGKPYHGNGFHRKHEFRTRNGPDLKVEKVVLLPVKNNLKFTLVQ